MVYFFIDDDTDDQEIFAMAISEVAPDATCFFANDGIEALEKLSDASFTPSCIFIDLNMPRMNGKECLAELRNIERLKTVPVIIYSTSIDARLMEECRQLGAVDLL